MNLNAIGVCVLNNFKAIDFLIANNVIIMLLQSMNDSA